MFSLSYTSPCEIQGVIRVSEPVRHLGFLEDIDGNNWDIRGVFGWDTEKGQIVWAAARCELHPYYGSTANDTYDWVHQRWKPYRIEVCVPVATVT